jgi:cytochrome c oxidase accessory protein FixG
VPVGENRIEEKQEKLPPLTSSRKKIFVKNIWGRFQKIRWLVFTFFLTLFYSLPWIRIDDRPPLLFDIPARKFHILSITLWPQDIYLLTIALITAAVGLFFSTAIIGRVWCGYMCPQTVFTSIFIEIERLILGDSIKQKKLAKMPMRGEKLVRLTIRNIIWALIAFSAGFTFLSYFIPNTEIIRQIFSGEMSGWPVFWILFITGVAFFDFGFFREQFCFVPCPYGRFQGALQDPNSLIVTYDKAKGETYNPNDSTLKKDKGACIDCNYCAIVCPTGIDIRNGSQFECISCARCIDACAVIQIKQGRKPDLIRYESENALKGIKTKVIRPRILIYTAFLTALMSFIAFQIFTRPGFDLEVTRNRNLLYQQMPGGKISNMYSVKVMNMNNDEEAYYLGVNDIDAALLTGKNPFILKSGEVQDMMVTLVAPASQFNEKVTKFSFVMEKVEKGVKGKAVDERSTFLIP